MLRVSYHVPQFFQKPRLAFDVLLPGGLQSKTGGPVHFGEFLAPAGLKGLEILKNLVLTNCKVCGFLTCMAYAAALRKGETTPQNCPPLWEEKYQAKRHQLLGYLDSFTWRALDE